MPADPFKKLLVRLTLDNKEFKQMLTGMRSDLKSLFADFHKESAAQTSHAKEILSLNKSQLAVQQKLQAEAKTLFEVDKAKQQFEKQKQESINSKIKALALQTSEMKKQSMEADQQLKVEKQSLAIQKEKVALKEKEVNLFKVGALKAQVKYSGFRGPDSNLPLGEQQAQLANEKLRLQALDKQVVALEAAGKYRRVDAEYVRSLLVSERALAEVADTNIKRAQLQLKTLEQQAIAASKVASISAMSKIKTGIGYAGFAAVDKSLSIEGQRAALDLERQKFSTMEKQLNVISKSGAERKVDIDAIAKELQLQRALLDLEEVQFKTRKASADVAAKAAATAANAPKPANVANIMQQVEQSTVLEKMNQKEVLDRLKKLDVERQILSVESKSLEVLAAREHWDKADVVAAKEQLNFKLKELNAEEAQLRLHRARAGDPLFGRFGSTLRDVMQRGVAAMLGVSGGSGAGEGGRVGGGAPVLGGITKATSGLFGGPGGPILGGFGSLAGGMFTGMAGFAVFEHIIEQVHKLGEAIQEATGPAQQLRVEFERLAERRGTDPSEMLEKMRVATRGLVPDIDLFKMANGLLKSNIKVTTDQMGLLIKDTVNLGRSMGKSMPEISSALQRAFVNPQRGIMMLARSTGISVEVFRRAMQGLPQSITPAQRATVMFNNVLAEEEKMLAKVGVPMTTLPELLRQVNVSERNFIESIAKGMFHTDSFSKAVDQLSKKLIEWGPKLEHIGEVIGEKLAGSIEWTKNHLTELKVVAEAFIGLRLLGFVINMTGGYEAWGTAVAYLVKQMKELQMVGSAQAALKGMLRMGAKTAGAEATGDALAVMGGGAGAATATEAAGGAAAGGAGIVALPVIAGLLATGGLQYAALHEQGVSLKQAREGIVEWASELKEAIQGVTHWFADFVKQSAVYAKEGLKVWADVFIPGWEKIWNNAKPVTEEYWGYVKLGAKSTYDWILENSPFGQVAKQLKEFSDIAEGKKILGRAPTPGVSAAAITAGAYDRIPLASRTDEDADENQFTVQRVKQLAHLRSQLEQMQAKERLESIKIDIAAEMDARKQAYEEGLISLTQFTDDEKALHKRSFDARLQEIADERKAQLESLNTERDALRITASQKMAVLENEKKHEKLSPTEYDARKTALQTEQQVSILDNEIYAGKLRLIDEKANDARLKAQGEYAKEDRASDHQLQQDKLQAYRTYTDDSIKLTKEGVDDRRKALESEFKEGFVNADSYIDERKDLISQELNATFSSFQLRREAAKNNEAEIAKIYGEEVEARRKADNEIMDLDMRKDEITLQSTRTHYEKAKKYLETEATIARSSSSFSALSDQERINSMLLQTTREYISELEKQRAPLQAGTTAWLNITEQIAQATEEQQKLNLELIHSRDLAAPLGGLFGSLSGLLGQFKLSKGAQATGELFGNIQQSMDSLSKFSVFMQQTRTGQKPLNAEEIRNRAAVIFNQRLERTNPLLDAHNKALQADIQALMDHAKAVSPHAASVKGARGPFMGPIGPSFASGGTVPGSGPVPIVAHGGEHIFPVGMMQQFVGAIQEAVAALHGFVSKIKDTVMPGPGIDPKTDKPKSALDQLMAPVKDLGESFMNLFKHTKDADGQTASFASKLGGFTSKVQGFVGGIQGLVQGITAGKSGAGGALSGGMAGMQFGAQFGGPIGAAIGGVGGAVMGGIFGAKNKQLMQDIHKIQGQMQSIVDSMQEGAITLSQAIADMRKERQAAIKMLANDPKAGKGGSKKGKGFDPSQGQAVINQIDAQISQLVNTQKQLLDQLNQQVAVLANPAPFQEYVQSLDQIIEKYQQFASAASGNAQEVANAQLFLNESLQKYVVTLGQQLNQAQQQAVQDSLTLLNLEYQRQQIINQEAQQEYDILTQGVLTRQRTTAMTKGQEIGQLRYQRDMQLQQMDEQIALQKYKVDTESKIFNMATTRIGLEMELLTLQEQQAGYQNEQTAALLQVVQQLQTAMANGTLMKQINALSAGGAAPTGTGLLTTLLGSLGLGGYVPPTVMTGPGGATNYLAQIPQPYQSITNFVNNLDPNFLMNLWNAMKTPAGSSQRRAAASEASQFAQDANTSGYDMGAFVSWINSGASIKGTVATISNAPVPTGAQPLPAPTPFPMPTTTGYAPTSLPSPGVSSTSPYQAVSGSMEQLDTNTQAVITSFGSLNKAIEDFNKGIQTGYWNTQQSAGGTPVRPTSGIYGNPIYGPLISKLPHYQEGTTGIPVTGPVILHEGEAVLPKPITVLLKAAGFFNSQLSKGPVFPPLDPGMPIKGTMMPSHSGSELAIHNQIYDLTNKKATVEMNVVSARSILLTAEMAHLAALNVTMDRFVSMKQKNGIASNLEDQFQQLYETRGRYGSGNFRREYL